MTDPQTEDQSAVLDFLETGAGLGDKVTRLDTHANRIFLIGDFALKLKRAVQMPFLDYSTRDIRREMVGKEFQIGQAMAPALYLGTATVMAADHGLALLRHDGPPPEGQKGALDFVVVMRRFAAGDELTRIAEAGPLDPALVDRLAERVRAMHMKAAIRKPQGWISALRRYLDVNEAAFRRVPEVFSSSEISGLKDASVRTYDRLLPLLKARGERGLIRHIHGDLHLGNIVLVDGEPLPFDAIEFSEEVASGDILYDIAFLAMDLWANGQKPAATRLLSRYVAGIDESRELDGLALVPFFISVRAGIRAMVAAERALRVTGEDIEKARRQARHYFDAASLALEPAALRLVAVGGLSGTGKSTLAAALAPRFGSAPGALHLRSDIERKTMAGIHPLDHLPASAYGPETDAAVYARLMERAGVLLDAGASVIVDAVSARPAGRAAMATLASGHQAAFTGFWLSAPLEVRLARIGSRGPDASDATETVARLQAACDAGAPDWIELDASTTAPRLFEAAEHWLASGLRSACPSNGQI